MSKVPLNNSMQGGLVSASVAGENLPTDLLLTAFNALPDAIYFFDHRRRLTSASDNASKFSTSAGEVLPGKRCCEMFWRAAGSDKCVVDRSLDTGERVEVEILVSTRDDQKRQVGGALVLVDMPTLVIVQPLMPAGAPRTAMVIARDISELRRAEADALAQRSFMASIADRSPDEIYALDMRGRITWMNERSQVENSFMLSGRYFVEFVAEDSRTVFNDSLRFALEGHESQFALRALRADGTLRDAEVHTSPFWKEGSVSGVLVFLRDVTERNRTQKLAAQSDKLRAVGELAAGVAHNLNNTLTVIQGRAQLLMMRMTDESIIKSLKIITSAVAEGSQTLRRILDFARRESATQLAPVELGDLLTSSVEIARPKWQSKSNPNKIDLQVVVKNPVYIMGDLAELREVVLNLLFNAVDAMKDGGVIEVGARAELESGCFWVADTGSGMPAETAARIFEPFFTTKGQSGTGLGLSASHGIITRHNGEILVVSEPGEGTRFEVRLPLYENNSGFAKRSTDLETTAGEGTPLH